MILPKDIRFLSNKQAWTTNAFPRFARIVKTSMVTPFLMAIQTFAAAGISLEPFFSLGPGSIVMELEAPIITETSAFGLSAGLIVKSELRYPTDFLKSGAIVRYRVGQSHGKCVLGLGGWSRATQPLGKMKDSDWAGGKVMTFLGTTKTLFKFSYTESELKTAANGWVIEIGKEGLVFKGVTFNLSLIGRHDRYKNRVFGISGWQYGFPDSMAVEMEKIHFEDIYQDTLVLTYDINITKALLVGEFAMKKRGPFEIMATMQVSPLVHAKDEDDHILRKKKINSKTWGTYWAPGIGTVYQLSQKTYLTANATIAYMHTSGEMVQRYYGDDPGTLDFVETGMEFGGIETKITSLLAAFTLGLSYRF